MWNLTTRAVAAVVIALTGSLAPATAIAQDTGDLLDDLEKRQTRREAEDRAEALRTGRRGEWAISPDGKLLAAGTPTGQIELWDADGAKPRLVLSGHTGLVVALAFDMPAGKVHSIGQEGSARTWSVETGEQLRVWGEKPRTVELGARKVTVEYEDVRVAADGSHTAWVQSLGILSIWSAGKQSWVKPAPATATLKQARFLADGTSMLLVGAETMSLHDLRKPPVKVDGGKDATAEPVWRARSKRAPARDFLAHESFVDAAVVEAATLVATTTLEVGRDGLTWRLRGWDLTTGEPRWEQDPGKQSMRLLDAPRAAHIVALAGDALVFLSPADGKRARSIPIAAKGPRPRIVAPDASAWFDADRDGNLIRVAIAPPAAPKPPQPPKPK